MTDISVIVSTRNKSLIQQCEQSFRNTAHHSFEWIAIENSQGQSLCAIYNQGVAQSKGAICVFAHEDVLVHAQGWDTLLQAAFEQESVGMVGVVGSQVLDRTGCWMNQGVPYLRGHIIQQHADGPKTHVFAKNQALYEEVVVLDGCFFAVSSDLFQRGLQFDEETFNGFHFYEIALALRVRHQFQSQILVATQLCIEHQSEGGFGSEWNHYREQFVNRNSHMLPDSIFSNLDPTDLAPKENEFLHWANQFKH